MSRFLEIVLATVVVGSVLAFGGVQPLSYTLTTIVLLFAVLLLLVKQLREGRIQLPLPIWPVLFTLWAGLQVLPLPARLVRILSPSRLVAAGLGGLASAHANWATLSIEPHGTIIDIFKLLSYLSAFLLAAYVFDSRKKKSGFIGTLIVLGCLEASLGIVQYLTDWHKLFGYHLDWSVASGTYINRNDFAGLLELVLPFILALAYYSFQRQNEFSKLGGGRRSSASNSGNFQALFYLVLMVIMSVGLVFSRSRGGILSAILALAFAGLLGQVKSHRKAWMFLVVLFLTLIVGYGAWIGLNPVLSRFEKFGHASFIQTEARMGIWQGTLHLIRQYPLTGTGLGTYGDAFRRYQTVALSFSVDHAHNDYLEFASDTGIVGVILLFIPIFYLLGRMIASFLSDPHRYRRSVLLGCIGSTVALLLHSLVDFNLQIPANAMIFAAVLGIGYKIACVEWRRDRALAAEQPQFTNSAF